MASATKLVILMHPHEARKVKAGTGRFAALSFADAEIIEGVGFDADPRLDALLADPAYAPFLLYPGAGARDLSAGGLTAADLGGRRLLVILLDATWALARKMLTLSPRLQRLPRLMFTPAAKSRWIIKQQPDELCLSTLEAVHELMSALDAAGLDRYERPDQLLAAFAAMQAFQLACAADPAKRSYRQRGFKDPAERRPTRRKRGGGARLFFRDKPGAGVPPAPPPTAAD
jgi:DTW domain-containing protein YfiP